MDGDLPAPYQVYPKDIKQEIAVATNGIATTMISVAVRCIRSDFVRSDSKLKPNRHEIKRNAAKMRGYMLVHCSSPRAEVIPV
jgi:hypothetical protein